MTERIKVSQQGGNGMLWLVGWLFTIGFSGLTFGQGVLALLVWPYYLGVRLAEMLAGGGA